MFSSASCSIDFVFCLDCSGAMKPIAEKAKELVRDFISNAAQYYVNIGSTIEMIRARLVFFKNDENGAPTVKETNFLEFPEYSDLFFSILEERYVPSGISGLPQNGLDALECAFNSDWVQGRHDKQHVVLITLSDMIEWSEAQMHKFFNLWHGINVPNPNHLRLRQKRMAIFAPKGSKYEELLPHLDRTAFEPIDEDTDFSSIDFSAFMYTPL